MASPEEMARLTSEVKHRTEDLQAFMRDLGSWQREVEAKDKQLINKAQSSKQQHVTPKRKPDADKVETPIKVPKQVDADGDDSSKRIQEAAVMKDRGNEHFKRGKYEQAIECYTKGMRLDPSNAALAANRAMALLKKGQFEAADRDCTIALDLDPAYVKAMQRRGTARTKLGRLEEALADFKRVLTLDSGDKLAAAEIKRLQQAIGTRKENAKLKSTTTSSKPNENKFEDNLKAGLLRVTSTTTTKKQNPSPKIQQLEPGQILPIIKSPTERSKRELVRVPIQEISDVSASDASKVAPPRKNDKPVAQIQKEKEDVPKEFQEMSIGDEDISARMQATAIDSGDAKPLPPRPKNFVQFNNAWRCLKPSERALYLGRMQRRDYAPVFGHSLDPNLLGQILTCLGNCDCDCGDVLEHLAGLASVPRMATMSMLLGKEDEELVKTIYNAAVEKAKRGQHDNVIQSIHSVFTFLK